MKIASVEITGFRNFASSVVHLAEKTLFIGANDVGKTNFLYAVRLLLDRSLSDENLEPSESDFHIALDGSQSSELKILIKLTDVTEDAVISRLKGSISADGETFISYSAERSKPGYKIHIGHHRDSCEEIEGRYYLKHIHFKFVESCRDITEYIQREKKYLLKTAKQKRDAGQETSDAASETTLQGTLKTVNDQINKLSYVAGATTGINEELKELSHHNAEYSVSLEAQALNFGTFVERLRLGASSGGRRVGLGGDGRNNQILVGLWMAKAAMEHDLENEVVIYCIEEPEAHLHPHQQRKLADYLVNSVQGQVLVSTHSAQIACEFNPGGIVRFFEKNGNTVAAKEGCSKDLESEWDDFGYRMSILPAEAFFSDAVLLVEGPSEVLLYTAMAEELGIDLDFYNISILPIDGIDFDVYVAILAKLEIPVVLRTDNDVFKVPHSKPAEWRFAGLNRALKVAGKKEYPNSTVIDAPSKLEKEWSATSKLLNPLGIFVSRMDLENDLAIACKDALLKYSGEEEVGAAVKYLQSRKAIRMREFLNSSSGILASLKADPLAQPLHFAVKLSSERRPVQTKSK
jgi:putative ATP-dependent endonuclease of the OLD family